MEASGEANNGESSHIQHVEEYKYRSPNKQFSATSSSLTSGLATPTLSASVHQFNKGGQKGGAQQPTFYKKPLYQLMSQNSPHEAQPQYQAKGRSNNSNNMNSLVSVNQAKPKLSQLSIGSNMLSSEFGYSKTPNN